MRFKRLRWYTAGLVAFLMGVPLSEKALADDTSGIVNAAFSLAAAIVDVAGTS